MIHTRKKLSEVVQLDDIRVNLKLAGSRSNLIVTSLRYKPSEVVQLLDLLTVLGLIDKKTLKEKVGELKPGEWSECVLNEMRQVFIDR